MRAQHKTNAKKNTHTHSLKSVELINNREDENTPNAECSE